MRPALPADADPPADPTDGAAAAGPRARRPGCARCLRPLATCLCRWITPTANEVSLLILQHPLEQHQAKGSARLLQRSLERCRLEVGERFDATTLTGWLAAPASGRPPRCLLLYPDGAGGAGPSASGGPPAAPTGPLPEPATWRLVLLDGTWRKTWRMLQANPLLQALPRWPLPAPPASRYTIRRARRPDQRSTLEAACLALGALEAQADRYTPLLAAFDGWVAMLAAAQRSADFTASAMVDSARPSLAA